MKTFKIEVKETLSKVIEIKANNLEQAIETTKESYYKEIIILDYKNHVDTTFKEIQE